MTCHLRRCVLNGLETVPIPAELAKLDCLSRQFVQKAKAYQTVVRLGTYTHKVPTYNSLKACKGTMFFLPLPLEKTMATLDEVEESDLPNPELYIISALQNGVDGTYCTSNNLCSVSDEYTALMSSK